MTSNNIPDWLNSNESYEPLKDRERFMSASTKSIISLMSSFKLNSANYKAKEANTSLRLFGLLLLIILTALAHNYSFVLLMIALTVVRVAMLDGERIKALLKVLMPALILSALILLPSIFIGNPKTPALVLSRIIVSVSLVMVVNLTASFNDITRSLKLFRVPDVIIFTLDLTIKYIQLLGELCSQLLLALRLRSIGKNKNKKAATSGVLGTIFIKAKNSADETTKAMECRGFSGKYVVRKSKRFTLIDGVYIIILAAIIAAFIYLEVVI